MFKEIPVVDLATANLSSSHRLTFISTVGLAFQDIGFVFVKAPEVASMLPRIYAQFKKTFDLPVEIKRKYAHPEIGYQRGWTPPFSEVAIACRQLGEGGSPLPDAKENWFIGPDFHPSHPFVKRFPLAYPPVNYFPHEVPEFITAMWDLYLSLFDVGKDILGAVEQYLRKPEGFFREMVKESPTVMRAIHYPPVKQEEIGKIVWACKHTDINLVTVLPASTRPGLWIRRRDGEWIPGMAPEGCVIVQVADMLDYLTGGYLTSAAHEVRAPDHPTKEGRYSAALFIHARSDMLFEPGIDGYPTITAYELLQKRLKEISLAQ